MDYRDELRRCIEHRSWLSARGTFTSPGNPPIRFTFRTGGDWRFESTVDDDVLATEGAEELMGAKADHAWFADGATLIGASAGGRASVTSDLWRMVHPERALLVPEWVQHRLDVAMPASWAELDVDQGRMDDRAVWVVTIGDATFMIDQMSGVGLRTQRGGEEVAIVDLEIDAEITDGYFRPPAADPGHSRPRQGTVYISEHNHRTHLPFGAHWEVHRPSGLGYHEWSAHQTAADAAAWAEERSDQIILPRPE